MGFALVLGDGQEEVVQLAAKQQKVEDSLAQRIYKLEKKSDDAITMLTDMVRSLSAGFLRFILTTLAPNWGLSQKSTYIHETSNNNII